MAQAHVHAVRMGQEPEKLHHVIKVVQWLSNAHQHNAVDAASGIPLGLINLQQQFRRLQVPDIAGDGGCAELTSHPAAHLGGDAETFSMVIVHENRLHKVTVRQFI